MCVVLSDTHCRRLIGRDAAACDVMRRRRAAEVLDACCEGLAQLERWQSNRVTCRLPGNSWLVPFKDATISVYGVFAFAMEVAAE
jgi:hypothetical protein